MVVPNWQHHSKKTPKVRRRPQAVRSARARTRALIKKLRRKFI